MFERLRDSHIEFSTEPARARYSSLPSGTVGDDRASGVPACSHPHAADAGLGGSSEASSR